MSLRVACALLLIFLFVFVTFIIFFTHFCNLFCVHFCFCCVRVAYARLSMHAPSVVCTCDFVRETVVLCFVYFYFFVLCVCAILCVCVWGVARVCMQECLCTNARCVSASWVCERILLVVFSFLLSISMLYS